MKKIAVFGGTFNPIHNGHIVAAQTIIDSGVFDEVHLMPSGVPPFKPDERDSVRHRIRMCELVTELMEGILLNAAETESSGYSYTYETLHHMKLAHPDHEYYWAIGYDNLFSIEKWHKGDLLLREFSFILLNRGGIPDNECEEKIVELKRIYGTRFVRLDMPDIEISSSEIRNRCLNGQSVFGYVPERIEAYIREHSLYL